MPTSAKLLAEMKLLHPLLIDLSLGRVERLLGKLGDPHNKLPPVVHVAGTNGKGSVTAYLKAILEAAGARVHVYTSPHLVRFHERIELAGPSGKAAPIGEETLVDVLTRTQATNGSDDVTQFEITTAAAFLAFSEHPADVLLLEVGLGGRLDATNVVERPVLDVITPISLDHAEKLGATLAKIACGESRHSAPRRAGSDCSAGAGGRGRHPRRGAARQRTAHRLGRALRRLRAARPACRAAGGAAARSANAVAHRPPSGRQRRHRRRCGAAARLATCRTLASASAPSSRG